jgi:hypothetical protein
MARDGRARELEAVVMAEMPHNGDQCGKRRHHGRNTEKFPTRRSYAKLG